MSRQATDWLGENLAEVMRWTYPSGTDKNRGIGQDGLALVFYFCDRANKQGNFFMQLRTMAEETGLSLSAVKRLMKGLQDIGAITPTGELISYEGRGKPTPEYRLTCVYGNAQTVRPGTQTGIHPSTQVDTSTEPKAKQGKTSAQNTELELEPEPQLEPEPATAQGAREGKAGEVVQACLAWELSHYQGEAGEGLRKSWTKAYTRLAAQALEVKPGAPLSEQVSWCVNLRHAEKGLKLPQGTAPTKTYLPTVSDTYKGQADCPHCEGQGYVEHINPSTELWTSSKCRCAGGNYPPLETQEPTPKRVSADSAANTYLPSPPAQADPQSDPVKELAKRLRMTG